MEAKQKRILGLAALAGAIVATVVAVIPSEFIKVWAQQNGWLSNPNGSIEAALGILGSDWIRIPAAVGAGVAATLLFQQFQKRRNLNRAIAAATPIEESAAKPREKVDGASRHYFKEDLKGIRRRLVEIVSGVRAGYTTPDVDRKLAAFRAELNAFHVSWQKMGLAKLPIDQFNKFECEGFLSIMNEVEPLLDRNHWDEAAVHTATLAERFAKLKADRK